MFAKSQCFFRTSQLYHHIIIIGVRFYKNIPERLRVIFAFRGVVFTIEASLKNAIDKPFLIGYSYLICNLLTVSLDISVIAYVRLISYG